MILATLAEYLIILLLTSPIWISFLMWIEEIIIIGKIMLNYFLNALRKDK